MMPMLTRIHTSAVFNTLTAHIELWLLKLLRLVGLQLATPHP